MTDGMEVSTAAEYHAALRERQARFRATSSSISADARTPMDAIGLKHGHLLAQGHEEENLIPTLRGAGGAVDFFRARKIKWWRSPRTGDVVGKGANGPTRNLTSSQVCCVNVLLPLASIPGALETLLRAIDPEVMAVVPLRYHGLTSSVEFEWAGLGGPLEAGRPLTRGENVTSADVLIVAEVRNHRCAYLFEWKLGERYKPGKWLGDGDKGEERRRRYTPLSEARDSSLNGTVPLDDLLYEPHYQLLRLRLLGDQMVRRGEFGVSEAKVVVVCPVENVAYRDSVTSPGLRKLPELTTVEGVMRALLRDQGGFVMTSPANLVPALRQAPNDIRISQWLDYQNERYGWCPSTVSH